MTTKHRRKLRLAGFALAFGLSEKSMSLSAYAAPLTMAAMRLIALGLICALTACASTYVANPNDAVEMAGELGDRGRDYVGLGEACDTADGGGHRAAIVSAVQMQQQRLGVLADLVN